MGGGRLRQQRQHRCDEHDRAANAASGRRGGYRDTLNSVSDGADSAPPFRNRSGCAPSFQDRYRAVTTASPSKPNAIAWIAVGRLPSQTETLPARPVAQWFHVSNQPGRYVLWPV